MPITFFINVSIQKTNINILVPLCDAQYTKTKDIIVKGLIYMEGEGRQNYCYKESV